MADFGKQLVIQFAIDENDEPSFGDLVALEDELLETLDPDVAFVDGHDAGSGEMNLFILTDQPEAAFAAAKPLLAQRSLLHQAKAAYRTFDEDDEYTIIWPQDATEFEVH